MGYFEDFEIRYGVESKVLALACWYEDNVLRVSKNGKYGIINFEGQEALPCEYDEITALKGVTSNF